MDNQTFTSSPIKHLRYTYNHDTLLNLSNSNILINSTMKNNSQINIEVPSYTIIISLVMYALIFVIGFFGNALVIIIAFFNNSHHQNLGTTNYCLVNLSVADLLLIIVCMPSAILDLFSQEVWYLGGFLCNFIPWLEHTIAYASILTIVAISIERSLAISSPLKAKSLFTKRRLWISVIIIWVVSSVASIPIIISTKYISTFHKKQGKLVNICFISTKEKWQLGYLFVTFIFFYLAPCFVLFILYGKIVCVIKNRKILQQAVNNSRLQKESKTSSIKEKRTHETRNGKKFNRSQIDKELISFDLLTNAPNPNQHEKKLGSLKSNHRPSKLPKIKQNQIIILLIVMMLLIMLSLLPYKVFSIWVALATKNDLKNLGIISYFNLIIFCRVTFYINSALNPIFYHIISSKFRDSFRNFFRCRSSILYKSNQTYRERISSYKIRQNFI